MFYNIFFQQNTHKNANHLYNNKYALKKKLHYSNLLRKGQKALY